MSKRLAGRFGYSKNEPFQISEHCDKLDLPLQWKKPRKIFVCSMGDIFHRDVSDDYLDRVFTVMNWTPEHTYQVLTKRPKRMRDFVRDRYKGSCPTNIHFGVTVENQKRLDGRIAALLTTPAVKRFISCEPLLGPIDFKIGFGISWITSINQIIVGAETGPGKRPMDLDWARSIRDQCQAAGVSFFFKKDSEGARELDGRKWEEDPE